MVQPLLESYGAISALVTLAYLVWGWTRVKGEAY